MTRHRHPAVSGPNRICGRHRLPARQDQHRGLFPGQPLGGGNGVFPFDLRDEHDGLCDSGQFRPGLSPGDRHLRFDGLVVGPGHSADDLSHRHPALGAGQEVRPPDAGGLFPGPVGVRRHRHGHLCPERAHAGALHDHQHHGGRDGPGPDLARERPGRAAHPLLARLRSGRGGRYPGGLPGRDAGDRLGQYPADHSVPVLRRGRRGDHLSRPARRFRPVHGADWPAIPRPAFWSRASGCRRRPFGATR